MLLECRSICMTWLMVKLSFTRAAPADFAELGFHSRSEPLGLLHVNNSTSVGFRFK